MAIIRSHGMLDVILDAQRTFFHHKRGQMQKAVARFKIYHATRRDLSALSDRTLKDLGIPRCSIKSLAMEASDDC